MPNHILILDHLSWSQIENLGSPEDGDSYQLDSVTGISTPPSRSTGLQAEINDIVHWNGIEWLNLGAFAGPQGIQGNAGINGIDGQNGQDGQDATYEDTRSFITTVSSNGGTTSGSVPNWNIERAKKDTIAGSAAPTLSFSLGRTFIAINGVFEIEAVLELETAPGDTVTGATLTGTLGTTTIKDYVSVSSGSIDKTILRVKAIVIGTFDGTNGNTETITFNVSTEGDNMNIIGGSSYFNALRIGDAPATYVPNINNS